MAPSGFSVKICYALLIYQVIKHHHSEESQIIGRTYTIMWNERGYMIRKIIVYVFSMGKSRKRKTKEKMERSLQGYLCWSRNKTMSNP